MKTQRISQRILAASVLTLLAATAIAQAQPVQQYTFPSAQGGISPPSTLRITGEPASSPGAPRVIHDTPDSLAQYQRCNAVSNNGAANNAERIAGVTQCLKELEARRQQGQVQ